MTRTVYLSTTRATAITWRDTPTATAELNGRSERVLIYRELIDCTPERHSTQTMEIKKKGKHTTAGIRWWSPTQLLTSRRVA